MLKFPLLDQFPQLVHGVFDNSFGDARQPKALKKISTLLRIPFRQLITVNQVHGAKIINVTKVNTKTPNADGLITNKAGIYLYIKTADCVPLLLFDPKENAIALVHVGWRGAIEKIFLHAALKMQAEFNCQVKNLLAVLGPAACSKCFKSINRPIQLHLPQWRKFIVRKSDHWLVDIPGFIKSNLIDIGLSKTKIAVSKICTIENPAWFSYQQGLATTQPQGRFASLIGIRK